MHLSFLSIWTRAQILNSSVHAVYWARIIFWLAIPKGFSFCLRSVQIGVHLWKSICRIKEDGSERNKWKLSSSLRIGKRASGYWFDVGHNYDFVSLLLFIPIIIIDHVCLIFFSVTYPMCSVLCILTGLPHDFGVVLIISGLNHTSIREDSLPPPPPHPKHHHQVGHSLPESSVLFHSIRVNPTVLKLESPTASQL